MSGWNPRKDASVQCSEGHCSKPATWSEHVSGHGLCAAYWGHACDDCVPKQGVIAFARRAHTAGRREGIEESVAVVNVVEDQSNGLRAGAIADCYDAVRALLTPETEETCATCVDEGDLRGGECHECHSEYAHPETEERDDG